MPISLFSEIIVGNRREEDGDDCSPAMEFFVGAVKEDGDEWCVVEKKNAAGISSVHCSSTVKTKKLGFLY